MKSSRTKFVFTFRRKAVALAALAAVAQTGAVVLGGTTGSAETVSTAGSTALKNWLVAKTNTFTDIQPGTQLSINGTTYPASTSEWSINGGPALAFQLAPKLYNNGVEVTGSTVDQASALRFEFHESGSVEGILELANDQIAPVTFVTQNIDRNPQPGTGNAVWVNYSQIGGTAIQFNTNVSGGMIVGADTSSTGTDNYHLGSFYNNNQLFTLGGNAQANFNLSGGNTNGGQNAVQVALSDAVPVQVFAAPTTGTDSHASTPWMRTPADANYGQGNSKLATATLGTPNLRAVYQSADNLNMPATAINPRTGTAFGTGAWNNGGLANLNSQTVAVTATLFVANPGTGLTQVNQTDTQFLQTISRLQNGATFNMTTRDVNSGTRNVAALDSGIDPTWAVGLNDNGNGNLPSGGVGQAQVGPSLRFSNKTAGGALLRPTVQANRMSVGTLSINDANGSTFASSANPVRALKFSASTDGSAPYVLANYFTISGTNTSTGSYANAGGADTNPNGQQYAIFQNEQIVTLKAPDASYGGTSPNVQGDNSTNDVKSLVGNTLNSVAAYNGSSPASPSSGLLSQGYIVPQLTQVQKSQNGLNITGTPSQIVSNPNYNSSLTSTSAFGTLVSKMNNDDPSTVFSGAGSSVYGGSTAYAGGTPGFNGSIPLTSSNSGAGGNYLFGNFSQTGVRDFYAAVVQAQSVQASLETQVGISAFNGSTGTTGGANSDRVTTGYTVLDTMNSGLKATKGDLITMGDYNGNGRFDGHDLYQLAVGASLTDAANRPTETMVSGAPSFNVGTAHIGGNASGFGTAIVSSVLNKNVALDYLQANATPTQKSEAATILTGSTNNLSTGVPVGATYVGNDSVSGFVQFTYDQNGTNAFNKSDVNQDGVVDINDALAVDSLNGKSFTSLSDSLTSTQPTPVTGAPELANLVLAQQIDRTGPIDAGDLAVLNTALTGSGTTNWYGYAANKSGPGVISFNRGAGAVNVYAGASLNISSGTIQVASTIDPFTQNSNASNPSSTADVSRSLAITVSTGGTLNYSGGITAGSTSTGIQLQRLSSLNISSGAVAIDPATNHTNRTLLLTGNLSLSGPGTLDLGNGDLAVQNGNYQAIYDIVKAGYANGSWQAPGAIESSAAHSDASHLTALGVIQNSPTGATSGSALIGTFDGVTSTASDVLVKYTYYGDANLDGKVDGSDYSRIDSAFISNGTLTGWYNGDFNYDGVINGSDYTLIDNAFNTQGSDLTTAAQFAGPLATTTSEIAGAAVSSAVPEPATLGLFTVIAGSLLSRRRRRA